MARVYRNFDITVSTSGSGFVVRAISPVGEVEGETELPFSTDELDRFLATFSGEDRRRMETDRYERSRDFGRRLYDSFLTDEMRTLLADSMRAVEAENAGLRVRLHLDDAPTLVNVPWEYLYREQADDFVSLSNWTPIVRHLETERRILPAQITHPLKVLVMIADPIERRGTLDTEREWSQLQRSLAEAVSQGMTELTRLASGRLDDLQDALRESEYHVFHFIGHGTFSDADNDGALLLEDDLGRTKLVAGRVLGDRLRDSRSLRLVVLNNCEGAATSAFDPFAGTAQSLLRKGIPAVVAMQFAITDVSAVAFSRGFYRSVIDGYPIDASVAEGRKAIDEGANRFEFGAPVLYLAADDGSVFDIETAAQLDLADEARPVIEPAEELLDQPAVTATEEPHDAAVQADGAGLVEATEMSDDTLAVEPLVPEVETSDEQAPFAPADVAGPGEAPSETFPPAPAQSEVDTADQQRQASPHSAEPEELATAGAYFESVARDTQEREDSAEDRSPLSRRWLIAAGVAGVVILVLVLADRVFDGPTATTTLPPATQESVTTAGATAAPTTVAPAPPSTASPTTVIEDVVISPAVVDEIVVGNGPKFFVTADDAVWFTLNDDAALARIDGESLEVTTVPIGDNPMQPLLLGDTIWVPSRDNGEITAVDTVSSAERVTMAVGRFPDAPVEAGGLVWVPARNDSTLVAIDPIDDIVVGEVSLPAYPLTPVAANDLLWVASRDAGLLTKVDPLTRSVVGAPLPLGSKPYQPVLVGNEIWIVDQLDATVTIVDPATSTVEFVLPVGGSLTRLAVVGDEVWLSDKEAKELVVVDAVQKEVVDRIPTGLLTLRPVGHGGGVWAVAKDDETVLRIDPETREITHRLMVQGTLDVPLSAAGFLWVPVISGNTVARIAE